MEARVIGVLVAAFGIYHLLVPSLPRWLDWLFPGDVPLVVKRLAALFFIGLGVFIFMGA